MKALIALFALTLLLNACGKQQETNAERGTREQILYMANGEEPRELDPQLSTGSPEHHLHMALYEGLVSKHPKTLAVQPALAERWEISEDKLRYTFHLRDTARWSNGDPITAEQVVWSWQRSLMPDFTSEWAYMKYFIRGAEAFHKGETEDFSTVGVRALGEHTLEVELNHPTDFFLQLLDHPSYYPVHPPTILAHGDMDQPVSNWTRPENWVGNGPFRLVKWAINEEIRVERNTEYWDNDNIRLNGIVFYPITDQQAEVRAFRSGQIHLTYTPQMAIEKVRVFKEEAPEQIRITPTYATYYYEFNTTKPPFDDARVRKAFALAIDRKTLVDHVTKAGETPAYSLVPNDPEGFQPQQQFSFDPEQARSLLAEAGYPNGEGFPEASILYNTQDNHRVVAVAIQQMLRETLGVQVSLMNQEWKVYLNSKRNLQHDIARAGWIADYLDPSNFLEILLSDSGNNDTGWQHEEYDRIVKSLKRTSDVDERYALFDQANVILSEEMPVLPIYNYADLNLVSPEVKGWYDNVMHHHPYNRVYLEAEAE